MGCDQAAIDPVAVKKRKHNVINVLLQRLAKTSASLSIRLLQDSAFVRNGAQSDVRMEIMNEKTRPVVFFFALLL